MDEWNLYWPTAVGDGYEAELICVAFDVANSSQMCSVVRYKALIGPPFVAMNYAAALRWS